MIVVVIKDREGCGSVLESLFYALLYPLKVPATSIYYSGKLLLGGEDEDGDLTFTKKVKMFERLGQYFLFIIL